MATTPTMAADTWNQMLSQVDFPRVPMFHTYISDRDSSDAVSFMNVGAAVKKYMTAIPMRIMVAGDTSFLNVDMMTIMAAGIRENTNALITMAVSPNAPGRKLNPNIIANAAPNDAPADIPVV